eukprot:4057432-Pyramimonas_sp.AAC.1
MQPWDGYINWFLGCPGDRRWRCSARQPASAREGARGKKAGGEEYEERKIQTQLAIQRSPPAAPRQFATPAE